LEWDDGAALRDILFTCWEQRFLGAAESGAPAMGSRDAARAIDRIAFGAKRRARLLWKLIGDLFRSRP